LNYSRTDLVYFYIYSDVFMAEKADLCLGYFIYLFACGKDLGHVL